MVVRGGEEFLEGDGEFLGGLQPAAERNVWSYKHGTCTSN